MTDNVNHPAHYETGKFECIEVMLETQGVEAVLNFCQCNAFKYLYRAKRKNGLEDMKKDLLDKGFFTAPASTKYHGNYEGGLFDHSYMVARYLKKLTEDCRLDWQNPRSPLLVGMFHDLCKMDNYQHPVIAETLGGEEIRDDSKWEYAMDTLLKGHGDKSVMVLAQYFKLTEEEIMCIRYHMGAFCDKSEWNDYTRAVHKYTNVLWTHQADMLASHVEGV